MPDPPTVQAAGQPSAATTARKRRWAWWLAAVLLLLVAAPLGVLVGLWRSDAALPWSLGYVPGLKTQGVRGSFSSGHLEIDQLDYLLPGNAGRLQVRGLVLHGLALRDFEWRWASPPTLKIEQLTARELVFRSGPPSPQAPAAPDNLHLPLSLQVDALQIGTTRIDDLPPLRDLRAQLGLGSEGGVLHRIDKLAVDWEQARIQGQLRLDSSAPLRLQARLSAQSLGARHWQATADAEGPLARFALKLAAEGEAANATAAGKPPAAPMQPPPGSSPAQASAGSPVSAPPSRNTPSLQADATITPFSNWPLATLNLRTLQLDLAALSPRLPETSISGSAEVQTSGLDRPASAKLILANARPGRHDEARLPLRRLLLDVTGQPNKLDELSLQHFELSLADGQAAAGTLSGHGRWQGDTLELSLQLDAVQPARLDARAAPLRISGPLNLKVGNLPVKAASAPADPHVAVQARLAGESLDGAGLPVQLKLTAEGDSQQWKLQQAEASAGAARASASGEARREAAGWRVNAKAELAQFDPLPWWRGDAQSPWRRGPHRLNGQAEARFLWRNQPAGGATGPAAPRIDGKTTAGGAAAANPAANRLPLETGQRLWSGDLQLQLVDSLLAGVPLRLSVIANNNDSVLKFSTELQAAGNRLQATGELSADGQTQRGRAQVNAPALAALDPLMQLVAHGVPDAAGWLPTAGALEGEAEIEGPWLAWRSKGQLALRGLRSAKAALAQADLSWTRGGSAQDPLSVRLDARTLQVAAQQSNAWQVDRLDLQLAGTLASHQLRLVADSPMKPPAWTEKLLGPTGSGSRVEAELHGEWQRLPGDGSRWRLQKLGLRGGTRDAREGSLPWLALSDVSGELALDKAGMPQSLLLSPGRLLLLSAALRWQQVRWQAGPPSAPEASRLDLQAELERIAVVSWLQRVQPSMGWSGDLSIGGRIDIRSDKKLDADIVLERLGGDLAITDELGNRQTLGLTDLRLGLSVHDGLWQFAQGLAGTQVGEVAGAQVIRTTAERRWPAAEAPLQGVLQARVANLGVWGTWVPPGWRLAGNLQTTASIGGKFGAPELRGDMRGSGLGVRNLLQGVNLSDGELAISLTGDHAQIERFDFRGGDGRLTLTGGATLGEKPSTQIKLSADHFRLLGRIDRRIVASGAADLKLDGTSLQLDGQFNVDEGLIDLSQGDAPKLDGDVRVARSASPASTPLRSASAPSVTTGTNTPNASTPPNASNAGATNTGTGIGTGNGTGTGTGTDRPAAAEALPAPLRNAQVAVKIALGNKLQLRGHGIDTGLRGELRVSSPGGRLALNGAVRTEGGTFAAYGQKLDITRGDIVFTGTIDNPRLDVLAVRPNLDVVVGVSVIGTAQNPRIRLTSEPEMAEFDKLSWLVLGRAPEGLGRTDTALLQRAAVALLAGNEGKGPTDRLIESLGLTDFSLRQTEGEVRETIVSLGRQLSRRWYVGYERSVNATTGTWQLIYRVAQRFTLRAQSGSENSVDMIWSWRW